MIADTSAFRYWSSLSFGAGQRIKKLDKKSLDVIFSDPVGNSLRIFGFLKSGSACCIVPLNESSGFVTVFNPDTMMTNSQYINNEWAEIPYSPESLSAVKSRSTRLNLTLRLNCPSRVPSSQTGMSCTSTAAVYRVHNRSMKNFAKKLSDSIIFDTNWLSLKEVFESALQITKLMHFKDSADGSFDLILAKPEAVPVLHMLEWLCGLKNSMIVGANQHGEVELKNKYSRNSRIYQLIQRDSSGRPVINPSIFREVMQSLGDHLPHLMESPPTSGTATGLDAFYLSAISSAIPQGNNYWSPRVLPFETRKLSIHNIINSLSLENASGLHNFYAAGARYSPSDSRLSPDDEATNAIMSMRFPPSKLAYGELIAQSLRVALLRHFFWFPMLRNSLNNVYPMTDGHDIGERPRGVLVESPLVILKRRLDTIAKEIKLERGNDLQHDPGQYPTDPTRAEMASYIVRLESEILKEILDRKISSPINPASYLLSTPVDNPYQKAARMAKVLYAKGFMPKNKLNSPFDIANLASDRMIAQLVSRAGTEF